MKELRILGIMILDRIKESGRTQLTLSKYAHLIKTRLGTHEVSAEKCSRVGVVILELHGTTEEFDVFEKELLEIGGIQIQKMSFML